MAREHTLVVEQVRKYLIKCMVYHKIKAVMIPIDFIISSYCNKSHLMKKYIARMIVFLHEYDYEHVNDMF